MSSLNVKNIISFNTKIKSAKSTGRKLYREVQTGIDKDTRMPIIEKKEIPLDSMPLIVVVIDEMADLMMVAGKEVENLVQRLAQVFFGGGHGEEEETHEKKGERSDYAQSTFSAASTGGWGHLLFSLSCVYSLFRVRIISREKKRKEPSQKIKIKYFCFICSRMCALFYILYLFCTFVS